MTASVRVGTFKLPWEITHGGDRLRPMPRRTGKSTIWLDFEGRLAEPEDVVSRLARLAPPDLLIHPAESVEQTLAALQRDPDAFSLIVVDSMSSTLSLDRPAVMNLRQRIAYYFRGNLEDWLS